MHHKQRQIACVLTLVRNHELTAAVVAARAVQYVVGAIAVGVSPRTDAVGACAAVAAADTAVVPAGASVVTAAHTTLAG